MRKEIRDGKKEMKRVQTNVESQLLHLNTKTNYLNFAVAVTRICSSLTNSNSKMNTMKTHELENQILPMLLLDNHRITSQLSKDHLLLFQLLGFPERIHS